MQYTFNYLNNSLEVETQEHSIILQQRETHPELTVTSNFNKGYRHSIKIYKSNRTTFVFVYTDKLYIRQVESGVTITYLVQENNC